MQYQSYPEQTAIPGYVLVFTQRTLNSLLSSRVLHGANVELDFGADGAPHRQAIGHGKRESDGRFVAHVFVGGEEHRQEWDFQLLRDRAQQYVRHVNRG